MATFFSDLHCHTTLFSFNRSRPDAWYEYYFPVFPAQGDFSHLSRGKVRVVVASLYPIEQGFVTAKPLDMGTGGITDFLAKVIVDMPQKRSDEIQGFNHDYYDDMTGELGYMRDSADPVTKKVFITPFKRKKFRYKIACDFDDLKSMLNLKEDSLDPGPACDNTIAVVLTIEGAHSLGVGQRNTRNMDEETLKNRLSENIAKLKHWGPPGREGAWCPFFISLNHHFWNQLGGHAVSLWKVIRKVLDQTPGINREITVLGEFVVGELLSTGNGRRILIDTAHMSIKVRRWYFNYLAQRGDNIPVIVSHTGVNGKATMAKAEIPGDPDIIHDVADELYEKSNAFNPWDVFISDEEIMIVHNSAGIIGLNLDQRIMMGKERLQEIKKSVRFKTAASARKIWIQPLLSEIIHIAGHILTQTGQPDGIWDNISIGSDFNGMITPIRSFKNANRFPLLGETMFSELKKLRGTEVTLNGKTDDDIREITDKIMWKNNIKFLEKHFH